MIDARIEYQPVVDALKRAASGLTHTRGLMATVAGAMHSATMRNFEEQGRPKWKDLLSSTKLSRTKEGTWPGMILNNTGHLKQSVQMYSTATEAVVGTNVVYAAIHQFGGRTGAHVIRPKTKRALSFGGIVVRQVNHPGSNIPARPFLRLTPRDLRDIVDAADVFVLRSLLLK